MKSLHQSAFLVKKIAEALKEKFIGYWLEEIYSHSKTELCLKLTKAKEDSQLIVINFNAHQLLFLTPSQMSNTPKSAMEQFKQAAGTLIKQIENIENERVLIFKLSNEYSLHFLFFGRRADVVLYGAKGNLLGSFRNKLLTLVPTASQKVAVNWDANNWVDFFKQNPFIPLFDDSLETKEFSSENAQNWYNSLSEKHLEIIDDKLGLTDNQTVESNTLSTVHHFNVQLLKRTQQQEKEQAKKKAVEQTGKILTERLAKAQNKLLNLESGGKYQLMADTIMANLTVLNPQLKRQKLMDWVSQNEMEVLLNTEISPAENANKYYKKAKNAHKEVEFLKQKIAQLKHQLENIETVAVKENIVQKKGVSLPYHQFTKDDFEIRVGKSAEKNDEMIMRFSHKNDTWLHAKDVAGSHVLICNSNGKLVPIAVLEYAAALAAKYSKQKSQNLAAVAYTLRKYVFKNKRMTAGKVRVEKEKTLMVKPAE